MPSKPPPRIEKPPSDSDSDSSTEGSEEEEEDIEDTPEDESLQQTQKQVIRTPLKNPNSRSNANSNPTPSSAPKPSSDSSEEEGDESESADSGSDSDSPPQNRAPLSPALDVKPISSKPMHQAPKTPSGASSGSVKRRLEVEEKSSKKEPKRKKVSELAVGGDEPGKKPAGESQTRQWNEEDEIVILKGLMDFRKRGKDSSHVNELYNSIKHLVRPGINKKQFDSKIRTIRGRYYKNLKRVGINGADPEFSKPHEAQVYKLSKKVWGPAGSIDNEAKALQLVAEKSEGEESESDSDSESVVPDSPPKPKAATLPDNSPVVNAKHAPVVNAKHAPVVNAKQSPVVNAKQASTVKGKQAPMVNGKQDSESISEYKFLSASILPRDLPTPPLGLVELFEKGGWNLMGASTAAKFDKQWKNVVIAEAKAYLERIDLVREQTKAMLDVLQSTDI